MTEFSVNYSHRSIFSRRRCCVAAVELSVLVQIYPPEYTVHGENNTLFVECADVLYAQRDRKLKGFFFVC